jgi:hypothetical protein
MSLIWCDIPDRSIGMYDSTESLMQEGLYAQIGDAQLVNDPDPNIGSAGRVIRMYSGAGDITQLRWILPGLRNEVGMGCRFFTANIPVDTGVEVEVHQYRNAGNTNLVSIVVSTTGSIQVCSGGRGGTVLAESAQDVISADAWRHIESEVTFSATVGTAKVWIEGVEVINATGLNTGSVDCAQVSFTHNDDGAGFGTVCYIKDIFIRDGLGTVNNGQIGPCTVYYRPPSSDVSSGWTSTGVSDFGVLDESPADDADYISADDTLPAPSIMEMDALPSDVVGIRGIVTVARSRKTDSGDGSLQVSISPNGTDWDTGVDNPVTTTEAYYVDVSELSPDTGASWTPTEFNSARIRLDRTV